MDTGQCAIARRGTFAPFPEAPVTRLHDIAQITDPHELQELCQRVLDLPEHADTVAQVGWVNLGVSGGRSQAPRCCGS